MPVASAAGMFVSARLLADTATRVAISQGGLGMLWFAPLLRRELGEIAINALPVGSQESDDGRGEWLRWQGGRKRTNAVHSSRGLHFDARGDGYPGWNSARGDGANGARQAASAMS